MSYTSGPWRRLREKAHALETEWATKKEEREADEEKRATDAMEAARTLVTTYLQDEAHWMLDEKTGKYTCEVCDDLFPDLTDAQFLLLANWVGEERIFMVPKPTKNGIFVVHLWTDLSLDDHRESLKDKLADPLKPVITEAELFAYVALVDDENGGPSEAWLLKTLTDINRDRSLKCVHAEMDRLGAGARVWLPTKD